MNCRRITGTRSWGELGLSAGELDRWRDTTRKMRVMFTSDGMLAQFDGYDQFEEFDFAGYRGHVPAMSRCASHPHGQGGEAAAGAGRERGVRF
jgi:trehalose/maltose hydrolase-like predicted phosphorylase